MFHNWTSVILDGRTFVTCQSKKQTNILKRSTDIKKISPALPIIMVYMSHCVTCDFRAMTTLSHAVKRVDSD